MSKMFRVSVEQVDAVNLAIKKRKLNPSESCENRVVHEDHTNFSTLLPEKRIDENFNFFKTKNKQSKEFFALEQENKCLRALLSAQTMYGDLTEQMFQKIAQSGTSLNENLVQEALADISKSVVAHYKKNSVKDEEIIKKYLRELEQYVNKIHMFSVRHNQ